MPMPPARPNSIGSVNGSPVRGSRTPAWARTTRRAVVAATLPAKCQRVAGSRDGGAVRKIIRRAVAYRSPVLAIRARTRRLRFFCWVIVEDSAHGEPGPHAPRPPGRRTFNNEEDVLEDRNPLYPRDGRPAWGAGQRVRRERRRWGEYTGAAERRARKKMTRPKYQFRSAHGAEAAGRRRRPRRRSGA